MADKGYCWCPHCKKWVPEKLMNYDIEDGRVLRICTPCMDGTSESNSYVYDPHHEEVQCMFCDSYDTVEIDRRKFKCNTCEEVFRV